jgi:hypothetical protein
LKHVGGTQQNSSDKMPEYAALISKQNGDGLASNQKYLDFLRTFPTRYRKFLSCYNDETLIVVELVICVVAELRGPSSSILLSNEYQYETIFILFLIRCISGT